MKRRLAITRILLAAVVLGMVGLSSLGYLMQRSDLRTLQQLSKENLTWSAAQIEIELQRFMGSVSALALGDSAVTADDVIDRFDILWSRVAIFENGDVAARYAHYDEDRATITALFDTMKAREEVVLSLTSDDQDVARGLIGDFAKHAGPLRSISVRIVSGEEAFEAEARDGLRAGQAMAATLSGGAVIMAGLLMAVAFFEARKYRRLADHNAHLASEAEAANQAKSRFLTMMSHELRTPMNGVLGQLALAKLPGLPAPQLRLVEQAERSGRQMIGMLTDILDFSALQENRLIVDRKAFALTDLAQGIDDLFAPVARREGMSLTVELSDRAPEMVIGDRQRLRQSITHLATYVTDTAGVRNTRLMIDHADGELLATLSFIYDAGESGDWRPDMLLGEPNRAKEQFASDALGPMVARGLIENMGGRIELTELNKGQTAVTIFAPAEAINASRQTVKLEAASATMQMICEAALRGADVDLADDQATATDVDVALVEVGSGDELARVEEMRARYPRARLIAIGAPQQPEMFDGVTPKPLEVNNLRDTLLHKSA